MRFLDLLSEPQTGKRIIVTASDPASMMPFYACAAQQTCMFDDADLAFDAAELEELFSQYDVSAGFLDAVQVMTGGYVTGAAFVRRVLRNEGERTARNLSSSAYVPLKHFIYERILRGLPPDELAALVTIASIGAWSTESLRAVLPFTDVESSVASLLKRRLLVNEGGESIIAPLVRAAMLECCALDIRRYAHSTIVDLDASGDHIGAALAAVNAGWPEEAVKSVLRAPIGRLASPDSSLDRVVAALPDSLITSDARLWIAGWRRRRITIDSLVIESEAETLLQTIDEQREPAIAKVLKGILALTYAENNSIEKSEELFASIYSGGSLPQAGEMDPADVIVCSLHATVFTLRGRLEEAAAIMRRISRHSAASPGVVSLMNKINIRRARCDGNWAAEKAFHQREVHMARASRDPWLLAEAWHEFANAAALAGDRPLLETARTQLRELAGQHAIGPYLAYASVAGRLAEVNSDRFGVPWMRAQMHWIEAYFAGSVSEARARIAAALEEGDRSCAACGQIALRVALAELAPGRRTALLSEAATIAQDVPSMPIRAALEQLLSGEPLKRGQPYHLMVEQLRTMQQGARHRASLCANLLEGTITRDGAPVNVSRKVFDLVIALSVRARPVERDELCGMLWPDDEPQSAVNALKMTVRRARLQCGDPDVVVWSNGRYAIGPQVNVDVRTLRSECEAALNDRAVLAAANQTLLYYYRALSAGSPPHLCEYEWFAGTDALLQNLQIELGNALAKDALRREDHEMMRALTPAMLECDPCDELAWEMIVRAHLAAGEDRAARRAIDRYWAASRRAETLPSQRVLDLLAVSA